MLAEMPVADITLNGLSRRACMAKSNVLRYFESREAVLLELCVEALAEWVTALERDAAADARAEADAGARACGLASAITASLAARPVLCDLISAQAAVLERNISTETVLTYKRASTGYVNRLAAVVATWLPELDAEQARTFTALTALMATATWTQCHTAPAVAAAYEAEPSLQLYRLDFETTLRQALELMLTGLLTR